jgi:hypothetical protein
MTLRFERYSLNESISRGERYDKQNWQKKLEKEIHRRRPWLAQSIYRLGYGLDVQGIRVRSRQG